MNHKKPLSEQSWLNDELKALRAEEPSEAAVDTAVWRMQETPTTVAKTRRPMVWRAAGLVAAVGALALLLSLRPSSADAAVLHKIAAAVRAQTTRYQKTVRPDADRNLKFANEGWIEGEKQLTVFDDGNGQISMIGYDGHRMFVSRPTRDGFIDDVAPSGFPIEDIDTYLQIPGCKILGVKNVTDDGKVLNVYSLGFAAMKFDIFIDPSTGLPTRRDVLTSKGRLIERNYYEYPADIPDSKFRAPAELAGKLCDYPAMRAAMSKKLEAVGQTKEVGGVKITLRGVIVGKSKLLALWTGGAKGDYLKEGSLRIDGYAKPITDGKPVSFAIGSNPDSDPSKPQLYVHGQPLLGDGAWFADLKTLKAPFTIDVAVWKEDKSRPAVDRHGKPAGFHSTMVGRVKFLVTDPVYADDPERVLWRPDESTQIATSR